MAEKTLIVGTLQQRHDTASKWSSKNPVLAEGEIGVETDTGVIKAGDGTTPWNSLKQPSSYTLPNATSSVLGGVKVGSNISVSSGTISVANASTSAKGVVQLSSSTSSTSTSLAATARAVKSAYDLANGKQSPATTLSGYGITDAYTKTEVDNLVANSGGGSGGTIIGLTSYFTLSNAIDTDNGAVAYDLSSYVNTNMIPRHITISDSMSGGFGDTVFMYAYLTTDYDSDERIIDASAIMQGFPCSLNMPVVIDASVDNLYLVVVTSYPENIEVKCYL